MALSPHPRVALVALLVALVAPRGSVVALPELCPRSPFFQEREGATDPRTISVTNGGPWGDWGNPEFCPPGSVAVGFQLKVERYQGFFGDDTGLNGVRLICDTGTDTATSSVGPFGDWLPPVLCPPGERLESFRLQAESPRGTWDDTAANDLQATCSGGLVLSGGGNDRGAWGAWSPPCPTYCSVCGVRTRVDPSDDAYDDSGLNDVTLYCCLSRGGH